MAATAKKPKSATKNKPKSRGKAAQDTPSKKWRFGLIALIAAIVIIIGWLLITGNKPADARLCTTNDLAIAAGEQNPAAGTTYQHIVVTNKSEQACAVGGYPTAFLYGGDGFAAGSSAAALPLPAPHSITLQKGKSAYTILGYPQPGNFNPGICSGPSTNLHLYMPGATTALTLPLQMSWCPGFSATALQLQN